MSAHAGHGLPHGSDYRALRLMKRMVEADLLARGEQTVKLAI
jgi:hypothetical protein